MLILIISFLFSSSLWALESSDRLETRILKAYPNNILILNRGLEDDIEIGDHAKLTNEEGFIARAVCLKRGMLSSHWKIYRVVRPGLVSKDLTYILTAINQSELPNDIKARYIKTSFSEKFNDWNEKDLNKALELQQERLARTDLPKTNDNDPQVIEGNKTAGEKFIERNFDSDRFSNDLSSYHFSLYASPFSMQSFNNQKNISYGARVESLGEKYQISLGFDERQRRFVDPMTQNAYEENMRNILGEFRIKRLTDSFDLFFQGSFHKRSFSDNAIPQSRTRIGPLGVSYFLMRNEDKNEILSVSYIPLIEQRTDVLSSNGVTNTLEESNTRHSLKIHYKDELSKSVLFDAYYLWQPSITNQENVDNIFEAKLSYKMSSSFYTDFVYTFTDDYYQGLNTGLESKNNIYTVNLRVDFEI